MLVLTRRAGDQILIGGNILITLLSCNGGRARIGIEAPPGARVLRAELLRQQRPAGPFPASPHGEAPGTPPVAPAPSR